MKTEALKSAYPLHGDNVETEWGLTKREHFAAMAMQGLWQSTTDVDYENYGRIAEMAVKQADALIEALNKESEVAND